MQHHFIRRSTFVATVMLVLCTTVTPLAEASPPFGLPAIVMSGPTVATPGSIVTIALTTEPATPNFSISLMPYGGTIGVDTSKPTATSLNITTDSEGQATVTLALPDPAKGGETTLGTGQRQQYWPPAPYSDLLFASGQGTGQGAVGAYWRIDVTNTPPAALAVQSFINSCPTVNQNSGRCSTLTISSTSVPAGTTVTLYPDSAYAEITEPVSAPISADGTVTFTLPGVDTYARLLATTNVAGDQIGVVTTNSLAPVSATDYCYPPSYDWTQGPALPTWGCENPFPSGIAIPQLVASELTGVYPISSTTGVAVDPECPQYGGMGCYNALQFSFCLEHPIDAISVDPSSGSFDVSMSATDSSGISLPISNAYNVSAAYSPEGFFCGSANAGPTYGTSVGYTLNSWGTRIAAGVDLPLPLQSCSTFNITLVFTITPTGGTPIVFRHTFAESTSMSPQSPATNSATDPNCQNYTSDQIPVTASAGGSPTGPSGASGAVALPRDVQTSASTALLQPHNDTFGLAPMVAMATPAVVKMPSTKVVYGIRAPKTKGQRFRMYVWSSELKGKILTSCLSNGTSGCHLTGLKTGVTYFLSGGILVQNVMKPVLPFKPFRINK